MTISREQAQTINTRIVGQVVGQVVGGTTGSVPVAVYPTSTSGGKRAEWVQVMTLSSPFAVMITFSTNGAGHPSGNLGVPPTSGFFVQGRQDFNLHPGVNTIFMIQPSPTSVILNWGISG